MNGKQIYDMLYAEYKRQIHEYPVDITPTWSMESNMSEQEIQEAVLRNSKILGFRNAVMMVRDALKKEGIDV